MSQRIATLRVFQISVFWRAIVAGIGGTLTFTMLLYAAPFMGLPEMDIPHLLGSMYFTDTQTIYLAGMTAHFAMGLGLALIYVYLFHRLLPGVPWLRGALYGIIPWLGLMLMAPVIDLIHPLILNGELATFGMFMLDQGIMVPMAALVGHLVFGGVVGALYGHR